ncbi:MAG: cation diffusion facilitator family transporter [Alicyclobacillus sp.]|nr:cation diffusion facilitator family transporter [Alicyclobacillus sp.]
MGKPAAADETGRGTGRGGEDLAQPQAEERQASTGAWTNLVVNLVLAVGKGVVGWWSGSRALFADAIHSAADLAGSVAVLIGVQVAKKPPDADHPYGHGKAELISAGVVAGLLLAAAVEVGVSAVGSFFHPPMQPRVAAAVAALVAVVTKELMFQYNYRLGKRLHSRSLMAAALDHRSDVFSSLAALCGIVLSLAGKRWHMAWLERMDAVASLFVALLVLKMGFDLARDSVHLLMDRVVEGEQLRPYERLILAVPGVEHIDELRVRDHGRYVIVDVKISVDADISVAQGHGIAAEVKQQLTASNPRVLDVLVHVNPCYPYEREGGMPSE